LNANPFDRRLAWSSLPEHASLHPSILSKKSNADHKYRRLSLSSPTLDERLEREELDEGSHAEATKSGGLLKYWFGMPDEDGRNLATCA